jgi:hypothetical protein
MMQRQARVARAARLPWRAGCAAALAVVVLCAAPSFADPDVGPGTGWWPGLDGVSTLTDLGGFIQALQQSLERLTAWIRLFQQGTSDILTRLIAEAPG